MLKLFTSHPHSVGETYWQHMKFAMICGFRLLRSGLLCMTHAIFPFIFKTKAADAIAHLAAKFLTGDRDEYFQKKLAEEKRRINQLKGIQSTRSSHSK